MTTPVTTGAEFLVNSETASSQMASSVTALFDGGFVITWSSLGQDSSSLGVYAQRYDASGAAIGSEFQVNTYTTDVQGDPSITALSDGGFVVTWASDTQDASGFGVFGQRYDAAGDAAGVEFQINTYETDNQSAPSATALNDGGFVVTWSSIGQDGDSSGIFGQRYDAAGAAAGVEFQVNTYETDGQWRPSITALSDGGFVVAWESWAQDGSLAGIYAQRFNASGTPLGDEFRANTQTLDRQQSSSVTALSDGGFVVTWMSLGQDGSNYGIYGQRYDAAGDAAGMEFQINSYTANGQMTPSVAALDQGGFIVTWESNGQDGNIFGVYGQMFSYASVDFTSGDDTVTLYGPGQSVDGLGGADNITGANYADGKDIISGGNGKDTLYGKKGNDTLKGDKGDDMHYGGKGEDKVKGGKGDDKLFGGKGNDKLTGGAGKDVFVFAKKEGKDTITDFQNGKDKIDLSAFNFASKAAALAKFYEIGSGSNDKLGFDFKGTEIIVKGIDMGDLNGADIII